MPERMKRTALAVLALVACGGETPPPKEPPQEPSSPPASPAPTGSPPAPATPAPTDLVLWFKLDPRLNGPTYGGERWVSPQTYMGASGQDTVEVRAELVEANGVRRVVAPDWIPSDPGMVAVSPAHGPRVTLRVRRAGDSTLTVVAPGLSRVVQVKAREAGGAIHVELVPLATATTAPQTRPAGGARTPALEGAKERWSYVLGTNLGKALRRRVGGVDARLLARGVEDGLSGGASLLTEEEARAALAELPQDTGRRRLELRGASIPPKNKD